MKHLTQCPTRWRCLISGSLFVFRNGKSSEMIFVPTEFQANVHCVLRSFQTSLWGQLSHPHFKEEEARADWDWHLVKTLPANAGDVRDAGLIPGLERSPGEGNAYPLQYSGLDNSMDYIVHGIAKSWTGLSNFHFLSQPECVDSYCMKIACSSYNSYTLKHDEIEQMRA